MIRDLAARFWCAVAHRGHHQRMYMIIGGITYRCRRCAKCGRWHLAPSKPRPVLWRGI